MSRIITPRVPATKDCMEYAQDILHQSISKEKCVQIDQFLKGRGKEPYGHKPYKDEGMIAVWRLPELDYAVAEGAFG